MLDEKSLIRKASHLHLCDERAAEEANVLALRRHNGGCTPEYLEDADRLDRLMDFLDYWRGRLEEEAEKSGICLEELDLPDCRC